MDTSLDYSQYTLAELHEAYNSLREDLYPERAEALRIEIQKREEVHVDDKKDEGDAFLKDKAAIFRVVSGYMLGIGVIGLVVLLTAQDEGLLQLSVHLGLFVVIICIHLIAGIYLYQKKQAGLRLAMLGQSFLIPYIASAGFTYYFQAFIWLTISFSSSLDLSFDFGIGLLEGYISFANEAGFSLGVNLVPIMIVGVIGELLRRERELAEL